MPAIHTPKKTNGSNQPRSCVRHLHSAAIVALLVVLTIGMSACTVLPFNEPRNQPQSLEGKSAAIAIREPTDIVGDTTIALSFSGGGTRAAAFAYGALRGLEGMRGQSGESLLEDVSLISSVSGGSITAAYYGLNGREGLPSFRSILLKDGEAGLRVSLLNPVNVARLLAGGLNDRNDLQGWLDKDIFKGATFSDLFRRGKPVVWINATNVYYRVAFPFSQRAFDALCSDLNSFPISEAVAASMAVPVLFAPVVLEKHPEACSTPLPKFEVAQGAERSLLMGAMEKAVLDYRDLAKGKYIKLIDGGVTDNYGLASIVQARLLLGTAFGPMSESDAINVKRLLFIVVDAGQGPRGEWNQRIDGPSGIDLANAAIDAAMATSVRMSYDNFIPMMKRWRDDIVRYRCNDISSSKLQEITRRNPGWRCDDVEFSVTRVSFESVGSERALYLNDLPTRLHLPEQDIDRLIEAGRDAVLQNATIRRFSNEGMTP